MKKLTFKDYVESKHTLRQAIKESPVQTVAYSIKKYCRIPVGVSKEDKQYIMLKPKQKVLIEWKYDDTTDPDVLSIQFENVDEVEGETFDAFWTSRRLQKWLSVNAREENPALF